MFRGLIEIVEPLIQFKNNVQPYLGKFVDIAKDSIPTVVDPEKSFWIYNGEIPSLKRVVVGTADILSTIHPNYLLVASTFVFAFFILYIKMKYPFWNQIPALHVYDWHRRFIYSEKPYIIHSIPKKTKYYESQPLIQTQKFRDLGEDNKLEIANLLQNNYLPSDRVFCSIQLPDLVAQCSDALISTYNQVEEDVNIIKSLPLTDDDHNNKSNRSIESISKNTKTCRIQGMITSRRINTAISLGKMNDRYIVQEPANYIDYLCFDKLLSSQSKIRKLFHTHEYNERMKLSDRQITMFKKEVELCDAIIPLVEYDSLTFYLRYKIEPKQLPVNFQMVRIQREHLRHLHDWIERIASLKEDIGFRVSVTAEIGYLIHLLQTNQMFAYVLRGPDLEIRTKMDAVYAIYFFRNAHMKYEDLDGGDTLHSIGAFCNTNDFELYFLGFIWAVREARKDFSGTETKMMMIDDIGHLRGIVARWRQTHDAILNTKCAYYFCNYVIPRSPYKSEDVNILI